MKKREPCVKVRRVSSIIVQGDMPSSWLAAWVLFMISALSLFAVASPIMLPVAPVSIMTSSGWYPSTEKKVTDGYLLSVLNGLAGEMTHLRHCYLDTHIHLECQIIRTLVSTNHELLVSSKKRN